jgi:orotidine-5'-phosphate decarboxylase
MSKDTGTDMTSPIEKFNQRARRQNSLLCVGLDTQFEAIPEKFRHEEYPQFAFNTWVIKQTHQYVSAYKPNLAFYEARGAAGWHELQLTMEYLQHHHPDIFTIADAKRADIGSTNQGYVTAIFDQLGFDAITLHPYLGSEALQPFLERDDKVSIILCRTSNPGAGELQDLDVNGVPMWQYVAQQVATTWNHHQNCMLVVGATYPREMQVIRELTGELTFLVPGIGAQGGSVTEAVTAGLNSAQLGMIINSSRGIIFASNPAQAAQQLQQEINEVRKSLQ